MTNADCKTFSQHEGHPVDVVFRSLANIGIFTCCVSMLGPTADSAVYSFSLRVCHKYYQSHYVAKKLHKAIATTGGVPFCSPQISFGISVEEGSKKAAIDAALRACRAEAKRAKNSGTCKIIEVK